MRIAVCYTGQLRTGSRTIENHQRYFGALKENIDVFIHTWFTDQQKFQGCPVTNVSPADLWNFASEHGARAIKIERQENYNHWVADQHPVIWYTFQEAVKLKRDYERLNSFEYDVVLRLRPDMIFAEDERLEKHIPSNLSNALFIPNIQWGVMWSKDRFVDDCMCFATSRVMDAASNFHSSISIRDEGGRAVISKYMLDKGFSLQSFPIRYTIYRPCCTHLSPMIEFDACIECDRNFSKLGAGS